MQLYIELSSPSFSSHPTLVQLVGMGQKPDSRDLGARVITNTIILGIPAQLISTISMFRLGLTHQTIHNTIYTKHTATDGSIVYKLKPMYKNRTRCDGVGMKIRKFFHQQPPPYDDTRFEHLAACKADDLSAVQQECHTCWAVTCDECRIHLVSMIR